MSVTNGVNLSSGLPGQSATQHAQPSALPANPALTSGTSALPKDQFVPSSLSDTTDASAQAAGLFTVSKSASSSSSSDLLSTPSSASSSAGNSTTKTNLAAAAIGASTTTGDFAPATSSTAGAVSSSALSPTSAATGDSAAATGSAGSSDSAQAASTTTSSSAASSASASGSVTAQAQLNSLNNALKALGLSAADIQHVDHVAQLTNDFNPTAFTSLVYQLEALARTSSPQRHAPPAARNASSNNARSQPVATANDTPGASASTQTASGGASSPNNRNFSLQSAQLQLIFTNGNGQSVQVQTPVLNSNSVPAVAKTQAASA